MDWIPQQELGRLTGVVVPAYFSSRPSDALVQNLLEMTLADVHHCLPSGQVWVVVDGDARTARIAAGLQEDLRERTSQTFTLRALPENGGKLRVVWEGMRGLLTEYPQLQYLAVRDGDGDHAMADLPNLVRAAEELTTVRGDTNVLVAGARFSRHHPMGWLRGELEALLDGVTLDALAWHVARDGRALDLTRVRESDGAPDISSGYKVYGRIAAERLFGDAPPQLASLSATDYWRLGPETVPFVEAVLGGASFGMAPRITFDGQPATSFGDMNATRLYGELLAWLFTRLSVPIDAAAQMYDNRACRLVLRTASEGAVALTALRRYALERAAGYFGHTGPLPEARPLASMI